MLPTPHGVMYTPLQKFWKLGGEGKHTSMKFHFQNNTKSEQKALEVLVALMSFLTTGHEYNFKTYYLS